MVIFDNCISEADGGFQMQITNEVQFDAQKIYMKECWSYINGGGFYTNIDTKQSIIFDNDCKFFRFETSGNDGFGVRTFVNSQNAYPISSRGLNYKEMKFFIILQRNMNSVFEDITIEGEEGNEIRFDNIEQSTFIATLTNCQIKNINANTDLNGRGGSVIFAQQRYYSQLTIGNNSQLIQCINNKENGGATYIDTEHASQFEFKITDILIKYYQATADTTLDYPIKYGRGIFLTGSGDFDISSPKLDLSRMRILGNTSDNAGQSLYVATRELQKWCNQ
ncbi:MAG: hypothetical protein EZS28_009498 [Streblomastix strix]|uniref:Right handed beta helix domain-containing protein n=1 Tax=Streblomastix strix TaxID=222440 RepID=A0A5J4WIS4_9EUKA|nr:MAG: hypothetical protein EZS28_009498 [Streblomastix strix]